MGFIDRFRRGLRKNSGAVDDNTVHNDITGDFPEKDNNRGDLITGIPEVGEDMTMQEILAKIRKNSVGKESEPSESSEMPKSSLSGDISINTNTNTTPLDETQNYTPDEKIPTPGSSPVDRIPDESSVQKYPKIPEWIMRLLPVLLIQRNHQVETCRKLRVQPAM